MSAQDSNTSDFPPTSAARDDVTDDDNVTAQSSSPTPDSTIRTDVLDPFINPAAIVRLIQCPRCNLPLRNPLRLPCGKTHCRSCLPPVWKRPRITYPVDEGREDGFTCWWCESEHALGDCGVDVLAAKVVELFRSVLEGEYAAGQYGGGENRVVVRWRQPGVTGKEEDDIPEEAVVDGGRLRGTYMLAKEGRLKHEALGVTYEPDGEFDESEKAVLEKIKDVTRNELDCQVCYSLILDPLTTPCGHTFCRKCLARILDHSNLCPICRRKISMPPAVSSEPVNGLLSRLLDTFFENQVSARREAAARDEVGLNDGRALPLFVCTLSFPTMPTFLHIFEPRYRLMIRRALENGGRKFGMVAFNHSGSPQGELGRSQFMQYGTVLVIDRFELLPDGRSLVSAVGVSRFKVLEYALVDGYYVGITERVDDVSLAEEERIESTETAAAAVTMPIPEEGGTAEVPLESLSTQQLLQIGLDFVDKRRADSAPWLHRRILTAYGDVPTDAARFAWWLASILPIPEEERYSLLPTTSVRERLKITARWVKKLETITDWSTSTSACAVL
ncbi:hypothetical protein DTO212C5_3566 [Paecilomyces variotii]|nr:hypothetical protein DTO212C5_3566 [Paecilomyces variotii]